MKSRPPADGALPLGGDVSSEETVHRLFATAERALGPITALVNNAGITGKAGRVEALELATLERVLAVNVVGTVLCAREAVRRMSTRHGGKGGVIVNLSSRASELGGSGEWVHYGLSKGAIDTFTVGLAKEVGRGGNSRQRGLSGLDRHRDTRCCRGQRAVAEPHRYDRHTADRPA